MYNVLYIKATSHMKSVLGNLFRQVNWESIFTLAEIAFGKYFPKEKRTFRNNFAKQLSETKKLVGINRA